MFLWGTKIEARIIILQVTSRTWGNLETWSSGMLFDKFSREFENYFQFHLAQKERFKIFNIHVELFCNCAASISLKSSPSRCLCSWLPFSAFILCSSKRNSTTSSKATIRFWELGFQCNIFYSSYYRNSRRLFGHKWH